MSENNVEKKSGGKKAAFIIIGAIALLAIVVTAYFAAVPDNPIKKAIKPETTAAEGESTSEAAAEGKALKVGFDMDGFEPFGYTNEKGEWIGFDLDLAAEAVKLIDGYDSIELVPINWDTKDEEMKNGSVAVIWNGFTIEGRENDYEWTKPYMKNAQVIVVAEDSGINSKADLKDKIVGTQKGSSGLDAINADKELLSIIKNGEPMQFDGYETALMELQQGSMDALVIDEQVISVKIKKGEVEGYKILDDKLSEESYGVAAKKGNKELIAQIEKALDTLAKEGKVKELSEKYFEYDATVWAEE